jgi:hypothetical protein
MHFRTGVNPMHFRTTVEKNNLEVLRKTCRDHNIEKIFLDFSGSNDEGGIWGIRFLSSKDPKSEAELASINTFRENIQVVQQRAETHIINGSSVRKLTEETTSLYDALIDHFYSTPEDVFGAQFHGYHECSGWISLDVSTGKITGQSRLEPPQYRPCEGDSDYLRVLRLFERI